MRFRCLSLFGSPLALTLLLFASHPCRGQSAGVNQGGSPYIHAPASSSPMPGAAATSPMDRMREAERRRHILADTSRILQLSVELKAVVDRTAPDQLSLEITRKAAEIEKVSHDLKQWSTN